MIDLNRVSINPDCYPLMQRENSRFPFHRGTYEDFYSRFFRGSRLDNRDYKGFDISGDIGYAVIDGDELIMAVIENGQNVMRIHPELLNNTGYKGLRLGCLDFFIPMCINQGYRVEITDNLWKGMDFMPQVKFDSVDDIKEFEKSLGDEEIELTKIIGEFRECINLESTLSGKELANPFLRD